MEPVSATFFKRPRITPDVTSGAFHVAFPLSGNAKGLRVRGILSDAAGEISRKDIPADADFQPSLTLSIPENRVRLWDIGAAFLYDLRFELIDAAGMVIDRLESYAGLRSIVIDGKAIKINNRSVFQRLVLDQGYYPDGLLTAPDETSLVRDIELSVAAGFNGARLHQKIFEERFLYHADRLGYIVWGEFPDWGSNTTVTLDDNQKPGPDYIAQWLAAIERDYSHPSIVGWCPLNETHQRLHDRFTVLDDVTRGMFDATKAMDLTRPVVDASGYSHRVPETDVYDSHDYEQDPVKFAANHAGLAAGRPFVNTIGGHTVSIPYRGQPYFVSEFGGIWWNEHVKPGDHSWGYGTRPEDTEAFYKRFQGLCETLLHDANMFGYCYTQLTDVFQEQNGIYRFDRSEKFDLARLRRVKTQPAAIESDSR